MNCDRCPHMKRIKDALRPCQTCEAGRLHGQCTADSNTIDWAAKRRAIAAQQNADEELDAIEAMDEDDADGDQRAGESTSKRRNGSAEKSVTNLSEHDEDRLRVAIIELFDLKPIELLLVQHAMHGGSYASFSEPLYDILRNLRTKERELTGKSGGFRSLAQTWGERIKQKSPMIGRILEARVNGEISKR